MFEEPCEPIHANSVANIYQNIYKYSFKTKARSNALQLWNCHTLGYKNVSAGGGEEGIRLLLSSFPFRMPFSFLLVQCWLSPFSLCSVGFLLSLSAVLAFSFLFVQCCLSPFSLCSVSFLLSLCVVLAFSFLFV